MTTATEVNNEPVLDDPRQTYFALIAYDIPTEGTISVSARSLEHAKEVVMGMMKGRTNPVILDIFDVRNAPVQDQKELIDLAQHFEDQSNKKKVIN